MAKKGSVGTIIVIIDGKWEEVLDRLEVGQWDREKLAIFKCAVTGFDHAVRSDDIPLGIQMTNFGQIQK